MVTFSNVEYSYSNQPVFSNLNLHVDEGEFVYLIGKSGIGKSTLLQMVYMNILPQSGYVQVGEFSSDTIKPDQLPFLRRKVGVVFQDFKLLEDRNVFNNLAFVLHLLGIPRKELKRRVVDALTEVGLIHKQNNMPHQLSGGEKQRVAIARAIVKNPQVILADEPTGNLDPETSMDIMYILQKISERGTAVIFATHNYELVKKVRAKIFKLEDGKAVKVVLKPKSEKEPQTEE